MIKIPYDQVDAYTEIKELQQAVSHIYNVLIEKKLIPKPKEEEEVQK